MTVAAAMVLVIWAIAVAIMSTAGVTGRVRTTTVNGMRRRKPGESDAAWFAGLRALYPFTIASSVLLVALAVTLLQSPEELFYAILLGGLAIVLAVVLGGIAFMNRAIRRVVRIEASA